MRELYQIPGPIAGPPAPDHWSFSSLQEWRKCPRRWWLLRASYPGISGRYPLPVHHSAVAGRLVHDALEMFTAHAANALASGLTYDEARVSFAVRAFMKRRLRRILGTEVESNPRVEPADLLSKISLDECVNAFRSATRDVLAPFIASVAKRPSGSVLADISNGYPPEGPERSVTIEDPPLTGRIDWASSGRIYDLKTGAQDPAHADQLRTYALLYWAACGTRPRGLEIYYVRTHERLPVQVPSEAELTELRFTLREEINAANRAIRSNFVVAHPSEEGCRWCPVRQYCGAFWIDPRTEPLRWPAYRGEEEPTKVSTQAFADIEVVDFLGNSSQQGYRGEAHTVSGSSIVVLLPAEWCVGSGVHPERLRVLGARIDKSPDSYSVSVSKYTEVFWLQWDDPHEGETMTE